MSASKLDCWREAVKANASPMETLSIALKLHAWLNEGASDEAEARPELANSVLPFRPAVSGMEKQLIDALLAVVAEYQRCTGQSATSISLSAARDRSFFSDLSQGRTVTLRKLDEVLRWFSAHWPDNANWPPELPRPERVLANEPLFSSYSWMK
jgi:hypothetical protein